MTTTDFKTCRKQCTPQLSNVCGWSSNCRNYCACWCLKKTHSVDWKMSKN